jgi:hypothetical protein
VELLVAMALIIFIMYILAEAFSAGATAFRSLKAIGDMNERLRMASNTLRRLLAADHFEGKKRLSDPGFWKDGPPREGFFRIVQYSQAGKPYNGAVVDEGADLDGNGSYRSTNFVLHFMARLPGKQRGDFFRASVPGTSPLYNPGLPFPDSRFQDAALTADLRAVLTSPVAEVCLFMVDTGETTKDPQNASGMEDPSNSNNPVYAEQKLYTLCLRQRLVLKDNEAIRALTAGGTGIAATQWLDYREVSCFPNPLEQGQTTPPQSLYFNNPEDLTMPSRRWSGFPGPFTPNAPIPPDAINQIPDEVNLLWPTGTSGGKKAEYPYPTFGVEESRNPGAPVILAGTDTLLTDVLSCDVKVLLPNMTDFVDLFSQATSDYWTDPTTNTGKNSILNGAFPGGFNNTVRVFDTWSQAADDWRDYSKYDTTSTNNTIPMFVNSSNQKIRILAIQITLRIWDSRTQQTRQTSIVADL